MKKIIVSPSILGATLQNADAEIKKIKDAKIGWIHFDVMDGVFVKNVSFEKPFLKKVCSNLGLVKDVHIMVNDPLYKVEDFAECGADYLTFHLEACKNEKYVKEVIKQIHKFGMKAGLSIKPNTPVEEVYPFIKDLDLVLIMSVEPGYGGQRFIESSLGKIEALRKTADEIQRRRKKRLLTISVDGGVNDKTAPLCLNAGANVLVVGQYLFNHDDFLERYKRIVK